MVEQPVCADLSLCIKKWISGIICFRNQILKRSNLEERLHVCFYGESHEYKMDLERLFTKFLIPNSSLEWIKKKTQCFTVVIGTIRKFVANGQMESKVIVRQIKTYAYITTGT